MDKWASSIPITDARARTKFAKGGVELPNELKYVMKEKENFNIMDNNIQQVKDYIIKKIQTKSE